MSSFYVYDNRSGLILRSGSCPEHMIEIQAFNPAEEAREGEASDSNNYFDLIESSLKEKKQSSVSLDKSALLANGQDTASFASIPVGSEIFINYENLGICNDNFFEFSTDIPGLNEILIKNVEYLDFEATINAI